MTIDEAIKHAEEVGEEKRAIVNGCNYHGDNIVKCKKCAEEHKQLADWLRELKGYREFTNWLVKAVLEEDWEESADFYAEVICRKLTKLGKLKVVDNKYMEVNADADSN